MEDSKAGGGLGVTALALGGWSYTWFGFSHGPNFESLIITIARAYSQNLRP